MISIIISLLVGVGLLLAGSTVIIIAITMSDYGFTVDEYSVKIKFDRFYELYKLNPEKWNLRSGCMSYEGNQLCLSNVIEYVKYRNFYRKLAEQEREAVINEIKTNLSKGWQKDISEYQKRYSTEIVDMINNLRAEIARLEERYKNLTDDERYRCGAYK